MPSRVDDPTGRQALASAPAAGDFYDDNCEAMAVEPLDITPPSDGRSAFFDAPIPRRIHQIWYGPRHTLFAPRMASWARYAADYGYAYKLWGEEDDDLVARIMPAANHQLFLSHRALENYKAASDVLRISLLWTFGGLYLDSDLQPPSDDQGFFDLDMWLPMRNVVAVAEDRARETRSVAAFLTNCLLMAAPAHPLIGHLVSTLPDNHAAWQRRFAPVAEYTTGPFLLTKAWAGPVTVLQMREGYRFRLFGPLDESPHAYGGGGS